MNRYSNYILFILFAFANIQGFANDTLSCTGISIPSEKDFLLTNVDSKFDNNTLLCFIRRIKSNPAVIENRLYVIKKTGALYRHYFDKFDFNDAIEIMELQANLWQEIDSTKQYNESIFKLANCHFHLGNYARALEFIQESIELAAANNDEERLMHSYAKLSWLLLRIDRYNEAEEANNLFFGYINKLKAGNQYLNKYHAFLSNLYADQNDISQAKSYNDSSLHYANQSGNEKLIAIAKSYKSIYDEENKNIEERIKLVNEALDINKRNGNIREIGTNYKHLGELYNMVPKNDSTFKYYHLALQSQKSINDQYHEYFIHEKLVAYFEHIGEYRKAFLHQYNATNIYYSLFDARETAKVYEIEKQKSERKIESVKINLEKQNAQIELELVKNNQKKLLLFLTSLILIGLLYLYYYRYKNIQKLKNLKIKKVAEKEIINLRKQAIRSQLNPHFLFNNLNSIKSYIAGNEPRNATRYLNKFALLMRTILNNSIRDKVSLNEEIEALKLFIDIEKYRVKSEIELEIDLDSNIDYNTIQISPSILQPFVENGIYQYCKDQKPFYIYLTIQNVNEKVIVVNIKMQRSKNPQKLANPLATMDQSNEQIAHDIKDEMGNLIGTQVAFKILKEASIVQP